MVTEIVKGDLDKDSMNLVNTMLRKDKSHLNAISELINNTNVT